MTKRLYKSENKILCGVCGGLAEYFNIDSTIIRLAAVVIFFITGVFPVSIIYIIAAVVMPNRPSDDKDWANMKRANDYTESDEEFNSHFKNAKKNSGSNS